MLRKLLNLFSRKGNKQPISANLKEDWTDENSQFQQNFRESQSRIPAHMLDDTNDYLGLVALSRTKASEALNKKQFDVAWELQHETIIHYQNHASKEGFNDNQTLGLLSSVYANLSSILQAENKHTLALAFYLYAVQCGGYVNQGVQINIRRICKDGQLKHLEDNIESFLLGFVSNDKVVQADLRFCQNEVQRWQSQAPFYSENNQEMIKHYLNTDGYLSLVSGLSLNIEKSLIANGIKTIGVLMTIEPDELLKIKGIGKVAQAKILKGTHFLHQ
jgi:hypothetical protein